MDRGEAGTGEKVFSFPNLELLYIELFFIHEIRVFLFKIIIFISFHLRMSYLPVNP